MSKEVEGSLIRKKDLFRSWLIWENLPQTCYNYERMMGQAVAHVFVPISKRLHNDDPEKKKEMMKFKLPKQNALHCVKF